MLKAFVLRRLCLGVLLSGCAAPATTPIATLTTLPTAPVAIASATPLPIVTPTK